MNWIQKLNEFGRDRKACFFVLNFDATQGEVYAIQELKKQAIFFEFPNFWLQTGISVEDKKVELQKQSISFERYTQAFNQVMYHLKRGDTYLVNLTFPTPIDINIDIKDIYARTKSKYKIYYRDQWTCFSPETFIKISNNQIGAYPMKGTIRADIPYAAHILLNDFKEKAEHSTIVDLLRNDLSKVAKNVQVQQLMYLDNIKTPQGDILQMSSEIVGNIPADWHCKLGTILNQLLPAGSISGAPKNKTLAIINKVETYTRGFYTGIAGYYDGQTLDSCVLIRFIEKTKQGFIYKSGGGITALSDMPKEYDELNQKIYVPIY